MAHFKFMAGLWLAFVASCGILQSAPQKKKSSEQPAAVDKGNPTDVGAVNGTSVISESSVSIDQTPNEVPEAGSYYETNVVPIIVKKCASCHFASNPDGIVDLTNKQLLKTNFANVAKAISYGIMPKTAPGQTGDTTSTVSDAEVAILVHWYNDVEP